VGGQLPVVVLHFRQGRLPNIGRTRIAPATEGGSGSGASPPYPEEWLHKKTTSWPLGPAVNGRSIQCHFRGVPSHRTLQLGPTPSTHASRCHGDGSVNSSPSDAGPGHQRQGTPTSLQNRSRTMSRSLQYRAPSGARRLYRFAAYNLTAMVWPEVGHGPHPYAPCVGGRQGARPRPSRQP